MIQSHLKDQAVSHQKDVGSLTICCQSESDYLTAEQMIYSRRCLFWQFSGAVAPFWPQVPWGWVTWKEASRAQHADCWKGTECLDWQYPCLKLDFLLMMLFADWLLFCAEWRSWKISPTLGSPCHLSSDHVDLDDGDDDLADEHWCVDDEEKDRPKLGISASDLSLFTKANLETIVIILIMIITIIIITPIHLHRKQDKAQCMSWSCHLKQAISCNSQLSLL